jgi:hypothetical protein
MSPDQNAGRIHSMKNNTSFFEGRVQIFGNNVNISK